MWSSAGFEDDTLSGLMKRTAKFHVDGNHVFVNEEYLVVHTPVGENYASDLGVKQFNNAVREEIERMEQEAYASRSKWQIANDAAASRADFMRRERNATC